jgi:hypothetical protein
MSNVHAWFASQLIDNAAGWVANFFETVNVQPASLLSNKPKFFIAETGWPTVSFGEILIVVLLSKGVITTAFLKCKPDHQWNVRGV